MYSIGFDIFAKDRAGPVIGKLGDEFDKTERKTSKFKAAAVAGAVVAGAAIVKFGNSSVNKFKEVGGETLSLMKTMGGTAEGASRLRFAATQSGVSFESFSKSTTKLSKFLAASAPVMKTVSVRMKENQDSVSVLSDTYTKNSAGLQVHTAKIRSVENGMQTLTTKVREGHGPWKITSEVVSKASDKYVTLHKRISVTNPIIAKLGIAVRDSHGKLKSMNDILPLLANKFEGMKAGPEKTALALQLFGKAGADMLPFLNKGATGIAELEKQSDKYGLTLSGKMLKSIKDSKASQREWNATMDGLKVQIGAQILPIMTKFVQLIRDKVIPVVQAGTKFMQGHTGALKFIAIAIASVIAAMKVYSLTTRAVTVITKGWTAVQLVGSNVMKLLRGEQVALNAAMKANMIGLIVVGVMLLAAGLIYAYNHCKTFREVVQGAFHLVGAAISFVRDNWKLLITLIMGPFGAAIVMVVTHFNAIRSAAFTAISFVVRMFMDMVSALVHGAASAFGWVPGIGGKLKAAARKFDGFKDDVNRALNSTRDSLTVTANTMAAYRAIDSVVRYAGTSRAYVQVSATASNGSSAHGRQGFAKGTSYAPRGRYWVGEDGPELMDFGGGERVIPHRKSMAMSESADSGSQPLTVQLVLDGSVIHQALLKVKRGKGGLSLGLA